MRIMVELDQAIKGVNSLRKSLSKSKTIDLNKYLSSENEDIVAVLESVDGAKNQKKVLGAIKKTKGKIDEDVIKTLGISLEESDAKKRPKKKQKSKGYKSPKTEKDGASEEEDGASEEEDGAMDEIILVTPDMVDCPDAVKLPNGDVVPSFLVVNSQGFSSCGVIAPKTKFD